MRRDWERWLRESGGPPPKKEDAKRLYTEQQIKAALDRHPQLASFPLRVFAKGSFVNRTNISLDSDVDIVVECSGDDSFFFYHLPAGVPLGPSTFGIVPREAPCTHEQLKGWLIEALCNAFGDQSVSVGPVAVKVRSGRMRLSADVVPAFSYRRYLGYRESQPAFLDGHALYSPGGGLIHNWPNQHYAQGVAKNSSERTGRRFKQMVRTLKRLVAELKHADQLAFDVPSFFAESLVFNVPDYCFGHGSYVEDMREVLIHIHDSTAQGFTWRQWMEVNMVKTLFCDGQTWTPAQAAQLASLAYSWMGYK